MERILILDGPNLNLVGHREPEIYGKTPIECFYMKLKGLYETGECVVKLEYKQSNHEGDLVDWLQKAEDEFDGVILNAGAYTHTSVAIRDAISSIKIPVIEVHISNIFAREDFRKNSLISPVCKGTISGFGLEGYRLALKYFIGEK